MIEGRYNNRTLRERPLRKYVQHALTTDTRFAFAFSLGLSVRPCVRAFVRPCVRAFVRPCVLRACYVRPSVRPSVHASVHASVRPCVRPCVRRSFAQKNSDREAATTGRSLAPLLLLLLLLSAAAAAAVCPLPLTLFLLLLLLLLLFV